MIFKNLIEEILVDIWPMVLFITIIISTLRIAYLIKNKKRFSIYKEILSLIFIIYILCLFQVVTFQDVNYGASNYTPFKEIFRYSFGSSQFLKNVMGNILLFIPFGFFVSYYLKTKKIFVTIFLTSIISFSIEVIQHYIGRVFDIDDIILNVIGGITGYLIYLFFEKIKNRLPKIFKNDSFLDFIIVVIIIVIIIYSFNINVFEIFNNSW